MGQGTESCGGYDLVCDPYEEGLIDGFWTQKGGRQIHIKSMSVSHIKNTIKVCKRARETTNFSCDKELWDDWIEAFETELEGRNKSEVGVKPKTRYDNPQKVKQTRGRKLDLQCHCGKNYSPKISDLKRGYGKSCCKRCAAIKRDFGRRDPVCAKTGLHYSELLKEINK